MTVPTTEAPARGGEAGASAARSGRALYITFVLALVAMLSSADRNILSVLLVPIQNDLGVNDTAMGVLSGLAFTLVYATVALPMARIADRGNRRNLMAAAVTFWSAMTFLCGFANSFVTLLLTRMGVAAGEAAAQPAQASMIGDLFSKRRGTAFGFITVGTLVGLSVGAFVAGTVNDLYGWKVAFMVLGAPGLIVALLLLFTVREPARIEHAGTASDAPLSWRDTLKYLTTVRSLRGLLVGQIFLGVAFNGYLTWLPAFLMRVHGMTTSQMSFWYGTAIGVGAIFANIIGGYVSDLLAARGSRYRLYLMGGMMLVSAPIVVGAVFANALPLVIAMMILYSFCAGGVTAVGLATGVEMVRPRTRGFTIAALNFCVLVLGGGLGPILLGAINDQMKLTYGDMALRYTLLIVPAFLLLAAIGFFLASRHADHDAAAALGREPEPAAA
jgi:MFS family permease